ncbi:hypothetical protein [Lysobacter sp. CA196]|uniref:hypothetical protein n=1 Tax=Lysobacter sp. CA196 TaxID=3455606 RepID=UPI003F8D770C
MRHDMYKVIVERPRRGGFHASRPPRDPNDERQRESLKFRHRHDPKWLNENLRPLQRYLGRQLGRRWDFVYSELCGQVDRRNTVQQHIHQHIEDFVAMQVHRIDGELYALRRYGGFKTLAESWHDLYVCPDSGCLMRNEAAIRLRIERRRAHARDVRNRRQGLEPEVRRLGPTAQLRRIDGIWYAIELAPMPASWQRQPRHGMHSTVRIVAHDTFLGLPASDCASRRERLYGNAGLYARRKRQLGRTELLEYGLNNDDLPDAYDAPLPRRRRCQGTPRTDPSRRSPSGTLT